MRKSAILLILNILCSILYSQEEVSLPRIIPPSPEAASLGKYGDIPVGHYTGVPDISIPLVELQGRRISIPISLSYHASGIKVNEIASRVGLGWNIHTGGMISRQVRGIPDDNPEGYINTTNTVADYFTLNELDRTTMFSHAIQGYQDYESDIYHFNFLGESGKFFFNQDGQIIMHPKGDLKITPVQNDSNKITGWEIITSLGMIFQFGTMEGTSELAIETKSQTTYEKGIQLPGINPGLVNHTSGWYLTQIIDPSGNKINFKYQKNAAQVTYWNVLMHDKEIQSFGTNSCGNLKERLIFSEDKYTPVFLTEIKSNAGKITFEYVHSREDLINDFALTSVKLFDNEDQLVDNYEFDYGYFNSPDNNQHPNYGIDNQLRKRLYLQKLRQKISTKYNKEYIFDYYTNQILPNRFSFSQDFWGYYNGQSNNVLYPEIELNTGSTFVTISGADRKVYSDYIKACTLKSVTYPTKGKTELLYESNTLNGEDKEKQFYIGNQYASRIIPGGQLGNSTGIGAGGTTYSSSFTVTSDFPYNNIVDYSISVDYSCHYSSNDCPTIKITKSNGSIVHTFNTSNGSGTINLPDGEYVLHIENGVLQVDNNVYVTLRGRALLPEQKGNAITGGLRIKEILFKDSDNIILKKRAYEYQVFNDAQKSSGASLNPPIFLYRRVPYSSGGSGGGPCNKDIISSNSVFPLNGQGASHVGYRNVTEFFDDGNEGKIEYEFRFDPDSEPNATNVFEMGTASYPLIPSWDYSHRRGLLKRKKVYKKNISNNNFLPVKETIINYAGGITEDEYNISSLNIMMGFIGDYRGAVRYENLSERYYKKQETFNKYDGSDSFTKNITYNYDTGYSGRTFTKETTTSNSQGYDIVTKNHYSDDIISFSSLSGGDLTNEEYNAIKRLKKGDLHRVAEPVQEETWQDGVKLFTRRTTYKDWGNNQILPEKVWISKGSSALQPRIQYHKYDTYGNPVELSLVNGPDIIYLWGYNGQYPVAKVENATYTDVMATGVNLSVLQNTSSTEAAKIAELNKIRNHTSMINAQVTTYTYSPLIGVSTITDPRGEKNTYTYDSFNRLEFIKDETNKLLEEYQYHYKN